jgi:hypothetical protein
MDVAMKHYKPCSLLQGSPTAMPALPKPNQAATPRYAAPSAFEKLPEV